jgi:FKBP-type peptidyl-prolyl cis-trans isomerase
MPMTRISLMLWLAGLAATWPCLADTSLVDTWLISTRTVTSVYSGSALIGSSTRKGHEFLTFASDKTVTGSEWLLAGFIGNLEQASYDRQTGDFFPTAEVPKKSPATWNQRGNRYRIAFKPSSLRLFHHFTPLGQGTTNTIRLIDPWINRGTYAVLGPTGIGQSSSTIRYPYLYSYGHTGSLSQDGSTIRGKISIIALDPTSSSNSNARISIYVTTTYTGARFPVTSTCCSPSAGDAQKNADESSAFLTAVKAANAAVKKTDSGLLYLPLQEGTGARPAGTESALVSYRGFFPNGQTFDTGIFRVSSVSSGVIKGWQEGLKLMKRNAKYRLFIPANLAYGDAGTSGIGPKSALVFDVELLDPP